jgi:hypothetical protein
MTEWDAGGDYRQSALPKLVADEHLIQRDAGRR